MKLSVVIPAHNEEGCVAQTVTSVESALRSEGIEHEILVVNDNSHDDTEKILQELSAKFPTVRYVSNDGANGYGYAVRFGLERFTGDCVAVMMADMSDSPQDLVRFYRTMVETGSDCVFGNRWRKESKVINYPWFKRIVNRMANRIIQVFMGITYSDTTNAFKLYKRKVIDGVKPILSPHFNLTIELPLKAIIRGYSYKVIYNSWTNRTSGASKLKLKEMGSRYFYILMYCFIEKYFSRGDFKRRDR